MAEKEVEKAGRQRSPNYPGIGLRDAVRRVAAFYEKDKKAGSHIDTALRHMGFNSRNGAALTVLSAIRKYGLVDNAENERLVPTQRTIEILNLQDGDSRKTSALQAAALAPDINRELFERYKDAGLPSEDALRSDLVVEKHFNPKVVGGYVKDFLDTLVFSGLIDDSGLLTTLESEKEKGAGTFSRNIVNQPPQPIGGKSQTPAAQQPPPVQHQQQQQRPISIPVALDESGNIIYAHIAFDGPLKQGMLGKLATKLTALDADLKNDK